ncbi:hypothetical protein N7492_004124 [Penicillium capsulatum]|uniref:Uncharacterized protein n=1 Tax=Penicillium capsulatum TaxID=69766 RepID=A0A9W9IKW7_9EURO|nr:hypothetical protein N7492_004124 [Penicillium capsulatum]
MAGVYGVKTPLRDTGIWNWFMQFRISPELDHAFLQPWRALNRVVRAHGPRGNDRIRTTLRRRKAQVHGCDGRDESWPFSHVLAATLGKSFPAQGPYHWLAANQARLGWVI